MKVLLLYKDRNFDLKQPLPWNEATLTKDLELPLLLNAMAGQDDFLLDVAKRVIFSGAGSGPDTILYRQAILKDFVNNPSILLQMYHIAVSAIESWRSSWFSVFTAHPASVLSSAVGMMQVYITFLKELRHTADAHAGKFTSEGCSNFFHMLKTELTDEYFITIEEHLDELRFRYGILISAQLSEGNKGTGFTLRKLQVNIPRWWQRIFPPKLPGYSFSIHPRDETGVTYLAQLRDQGINVVANALAQSNDHILGFFNAMRTELAFYTGCLNLHDRLAELGEPCVFPHIATTDKPGHSFTGLYDACLALSMKRKITGNDLRTDGTRLIIISGANQGGKSTFLRSIGLAQLMMQSGMFVPAVSFRANICSNLFTHFKREEDATMKSGKFDEELSRMSDIADHITPNSLLLFNESFAATNEREGSEIAWQIVHALWENQLTIFFVTHLYEFARRCYEEQGDKAIFLRADRQADASRSYQLMAGKPLPTSYGIDLYNRIFESNQSP